MGEASNPGPKKRRRRVMSSPEPSDNDLSFLDGFEKDFCSVGWDGGHCTTVVEESGRPTLFDMTIDDSEEVSGGASRVRRRRRSVLVPLLGQEKRTGTKRTETGQKKRHLCVCWCVCMWYVCVCVCCVCWSKICVLPRTPRPSARPPFRRTAQNSLFFFFLPPPFSLFFSLWDLLLSFFLSPGAGGLQAAGGFHTTT